MTDEVFRDKAGRRLGFIRHRGECLVLYDAAGRRLGEYNPKSNVTRDAAGRRIGQGNLLTSLL